MATIVIPNMRHGYWDIAQRVMQGDVASPRDQRTVELLDLVVILDDPADALPVGVGRKLNLKIAAIEAAQLVGEFTSPKRVLAASPHFEAFMDGGAFWGAYGQRIGGQMSHVIRKLREDRDSRQAIVTLWSPELDNTAGMHDYPCTTMLQFLIRKDRLIMHTTMRSNDFWLGFAYDVFQFTQLQLTVARVLGIRPGPYHHHAVSFHAYERDWEKIESLTMPTTFPDDHPLGFGVDGEHEDWPSMRRRAREVAGLVPLQPVPDVAWTSSECWYAERIERDI